MTAWYNEIDPKAAQWLRELMKAGHIAPGIVDERSIIDVRPDELAQYTQCHFFAGIGVWSYALRLAGWPDGKPVWTGSCPCQPFSSAGKQKGFADERHLWPQFHNLIKERRPNVVFGEQVAGKNGETWFDNVQSDMERENYACGAVTFPACGVGAPHQRQRLYWVAQSDSRECNRGAIHGGLRQYRKEVRREQTNGISPGSSAACNGVANSKGQRCERRMHPQVGKLSQDGGPGTIDDSVAHSDSSRHERQRGSEMYSIRETGPHVDNCNPTNGHWANCEWVPCIDGKARAIEPGTFPLVNGATHRVGRLRGYGNAIVAPQAQTFIETFMEIK